MGHPRHCVPRVYIYYSMYSVFAYSTLTNRKFCMIIGIIKRDCHHACNLGFNCLCSVNRLGTSIAIIIVFVRDRFSRERS